MRTSNQIGVVRKSKLSTTLKTDNHDHGINVVVTSRPEWGARLHFTRKDRRLELCAVEVGRGRSDRLKVGLRDEGGKLELTLDDQPVTEERLITMLLDRFTDQVTELESAEM